MLVNRIREQEMSLKNKIAFKFDSNGRVNHQYGNTECKLENPVTLTILTPELVLSV